MLNLCGVKPILRSCVSAYRGSKKTSIACPRSPFSARPAQLAMLALVVSAFPAIAATRSATATSLSATPATSTSSSVITMTAKVSSSGSPLSGGTVSFVDTYNGVSANLGTIQIQSANGAAGTAVLQTEVGGVGSHSLIATFNGTKAFAPSSSSAQTISFTPFYRSATDIAATGASGNYSLTAIASAFGPNAPTGKIAFSNATANIALSTAPLDLATLTTGFTPVRKYPIANLTSGSSFAAAAPATGDFNGDGKPDFVVPTAAGPVVILLGNGDGTFTAAPSLTASSPSSAVVGDFNGDGKQDVAVLNTSGAGSVSVFLGNGDGTFRAAQTFSVAASTSDSRLLAVGDFNGDGIQDLVATNHLLDQVAVLLGNGDGTFQLASFYATGAQPWNVVVGDINNDGNQDIATADDNDTNVTILLGNGDGTFRQGTYPSVPGSQAGSVVFGDFNNDGNLDLAVTDQGNDRIYILLGKGDGTFKPAVTYAMVGGPYYLTVGDFNRDGKLDIISANNAGSSVGVMRGNGDGTFNAPTYYPTGGATIFATVGDLNGDAQVDVAAVTASGLSILLAGQAESATINAVDVHGCGPQSVTATFSGDTTYSASTSSATPLTPTTLPTVLSLAVVPLSSTFGQQVTLTATLAPASYGNITTDGELITFKNGATVLGTGALTSGVASFNVTSLSLGSNSLTAVYTADCAYKGSTSATVKNAVTKGLPTITWATPLPITYGTALSATQLNATASVPGTFIYTPAAGTVLSAGSRVLSVTFTPADSVDYLPATTTVTLLVKQATPIMTWSTPSAIPYGTALSATQLNATASVPGTFVYAPAAGAVLAAGPRTLNVTFTPTDSVNYTTATASVSITVNQSAATITWATPAAITYGTALSATQLNATASVPGTFVYTPAAGVVLAAGPRTLNVTFTPTDSVDYATASASVTLTVGKATPVLTWAAPASIAYGTALSAAQLNATASVPGAFAYTPAAGTVLGVGTQTLSVTFTPTDSADYNTATASVSLVVSKATLVLTWPQPAAIPYGTALSATQLNATATVPGTFVYTPAAGAILAAGTQTLSVTFTPTDTTNNTTATASVILIITKATPTLTWATPAAIVYGTALSATQLNATASVAGAFAYTPAAGAILTAGTQTLSVTFTPTDAVNYTTATASVSLVVTKAALLLTWAQPAAITYGTALSATQLNATASVAGTFAYTPAAGTVLPAGTQTLSVTFTPTDTTNYTTTSASVSLTVNKARPVLTWTSPVSIPYGTALSATQLNATASVPGIFAYTPAAGVVLSAGAQTLNVTFTPTDAANYTTATASVTLTVNTGTSSITWAQPAPIAYGTALSATQLNATASVPGTFVYSPAAATVLAVGLHTLNVTFTPTDSVNYSAATASVALTVNKATPAITWAAPVPIAYGTALSATQLNATASVPGTFVYNPAVGVVLSAGAQTLNVTFTPADATNYTTATASVGMTVTNGTSLITWGQPAPISYGTALSATQLNATASVPGTFAYTPASGIVLAAGLHSLSVTFTPNDTTNYATATASVSLTVNKATPVLTWAPPTPISYGTPLTATQLNATASVPGTFVYTPAAGALLSSGTQSLNVTFTPTDAANYITATASVSLTVTGGTPLITWAQPAAITYGTALGATQLSATASVPGTFTYAPVAGAVLPAGPQTLNVTFTPTDSANYSTALASVTLTVNKATPVITWALPAPITFGTALSATQLNATASVPGTFIYTPAAGVVLSSGTQTLNVSFIPTDAANYATATASVTIKVGSGTSLITWAQPAPITYGTALSATQLNATASVPGTFVYTPSAGTVLSAGPHTLSVAFTPTDTVNYSAGAATVTITVGQATLQASANDASRGYGLANPVFNGTLTGAVNGDTFTETFSTNATASSPTGSYTIVPSVSGANLASYALVVKTGSLLVTKASLTVTANNAIRAIGAADPSFSATITGFVAGDTLANSVSGQPVFSTTAIASSPAGSYSITPAGGTLAANNYSFTFIPGTLTVGGTTLVVQANDATRFFGLPNPSFTSTVNGAVNGDTFSETYSTTATAGSSPGAYPIAVTPAGTNLASYAVTVKPGTLTIVKALTTTTTSSPATQVSLYSTITMSAFVQSTTTGIPSGNATFFDGSQQIGTASLNNGTATLTTTFSTTGTHNVTATYSGDTNFTGSSSPALVKTIVQPFVVSVTPNPISVAAKHTAHMVLTVTPAPGFTGIVGLACSRVHVADSVCTLGVTSMTFTAAGGSQTTNLTVTTSITPIAAIRSEGPVGGSPLLPAISLWIPGLLLGGFRLGKGGSGRQKQLLVALLLLLGVAAGLSGCGSGKPQESGTYTVSIQAQAGIGSQTYTQTLPVVINVQP